MTYLDLRSKMFIYNVVRKSGEEGLRLAVPVKLDDSMGKVDGILAVIKTLNESLESYMKAHPSFRPIRRKEEDTEDFDTITEVSLMGDTIDLAIPIKLSKYITSRLGSDADSFMECAWVLIESLNDKLRELTSFKSIVEIG